MPDVKIILALVASYFILVLAAIVWGRYKENRTLLPKIEEFLLANRNLPTSVLVLTMIGSLFSAFTVIGVPGLAYSHGIAAMGWSPFAVALCCIIFLTYGKALRRYAKEHVKRHYTENKSNTAKVTNFSVRESF